MAQQLCTKCKWEGEIEASYTGTYRTLEFKKGAETFTSKTTVSSSKGVLTRTDCRTFVTFQPVEWS